jgi:Arc/MetJ family transcription regulator
MRTNIVIDATLLQEALKATGLRTNREVAELGLRALLRPVLRRQEQIKRFRGKLHWQRDLESSRTP